MEDRVWCKLGDCSLHRGGVEVGEGGFVGGWVGYPTVEQVGYGGKEAGLEGFLLGAWARRSSNYWKGWVERTEGTKEELGAEEG